MRSLGLYITLTATTIVVMSSVVLIVLAFCLFLIMQSGNTFPTVMVEIPGQGPVMGNFNQTEWSKQTYMQFRGIPYAESPSGNRRFMPPVARLPWHEVLIATDYGRRCPVLTTISKLTSTGLQQDLEDCLNLCVYTKNLKARQPVMFYIYGGGYINGSSSDHPPKYLLEQNIVLVVPHYRVGALGWLTTYSEQMPGNTPIADILLALKWVQQYIHVFGGDPEQVTIFGQSAGASVASAILLSPKTPNGSFQRAIVQSGSIFANWANRREPRLQALRVCKALGCTLCQEEANLQSCMLNANVKHLLEVTKNESFGPVVGDLQNILPSHPNELIKHYKRQIPLMTGFTKHDGSFVIATYYDGLKSAHLNVSQITVREFIKGILSINNDTCGLSDQLLTRMLFTPQLLASRDHKAALPSYFDLTNNIFMKSPVISLASKVFATKHAPVYVYSFDYDGEHTRFGYEMGNAHYPFNGGIHHSNDNIYLFSTHKLNEKDTKMAQKMVAIWTSFAMTGIPKSNDLIEDATIKAMTNEAGPYFHINEKITTNEDMLEELTETKNDPNNHWLDRPEIKF